MLLAQGRRAKNIKSIVVAHNLNKELLFTNPAVQSSNAFDNYIHSTLPQIITPVFNELIDLYPPLVGSVTTLGYNDSIGRLATVLGDLIVNCNANALYKSFPNTSYALLFAEGAGLHSIDIKYIFYNGGPAKDSFGLPVNDTVAHTIQDWLLRFVATGSPNAAGSPALPLYQPRRTMAWVWDKGLGTNVTDPARQDRCDFWQRTPYYAYAA